MDEWDWEININSFISFPDKTNRAYFIRAAQRNMYFVAFLRFDLVLFFRVSRVLDIAVVDAQFV